MNDLNDKISFKRVIVLAGAVIAYYVGAGYATGQEMLQYYTGYGLICLVSCVIYFLFYWYVNDSFLRAGKIGEFDGGMKQICKYYAGKYLGTFYDWYGSIFCYLCFIVMAAAGGAVINQQFGAPTWVGVLVIAIPCGITVSAGLKKLVNVIGALGPIIIIMVIAGGIMGIVKGETGIARGAELAQTLEIMRVAPNWWQAIISSVGFPIMWMVPFFAGIGKSEKNFKDAKYGALLGIFLVALCFGLVAVSEMANIELVYDSQVPMLLIWNTFYPAWAIVLAACMAAGIFTTGVPLLWIGANRLTVEGSKKYMIVTAVLVVIAVFVALALPFNRLMNIIYGVNGYIQFSFFAFVIARHIRNVRARQLGANTPGDPK